MKVTRTLSGSISKGLGNNPVPVSLRSVGVTPNESWRANVCQSRGLTSSEGVAVSLTLMTEHLPRVCLEWGQEVFAQPCPYAGHVSIAEHSF